MPLCSPSYSMRMVSKCIPHNTNCNAPNPRKSPNTDCLLQIYILWLRIPNCNIFVCRRHPTYRTLSMLTIKLPFLILGPSYQPSNTFRVRHLSSNSSPQLPPGLDLGRPHGRSALPCGPGGYLLTSLSRTATCVCAPCTQSSEGDTQPRAEAACHRTRRLGQ